MLRQYLFRGGFLLKISIRFFIAGIKCKILINAISHNNYAETLALLNRDTQK